MPVSLAFTPGSIIRWQNRSFGIEQEAERKTKKARRAREMRDNPPTHPSASPAKSGPSAVTIPETDLYPDTVEAFEGIIEPDWPRPEATC